MWLTEREEKGRRMCMTTSGGGFVPRNDKMAGAEWWSWSWSWREGQRKKAGRQGQRDGTILEQGSLSRRGYGVGLFHSPRVMTALAALSSIDSLLNHDARSDRRPSLAHRSPIAPT